MKTTRLLIATLVIGNLFNALAPAFAQTWQQTPTAPVPWYSIACSADGRTIVVGVGNDNSGPIYSSTNFGTTWISNDAPNRAWSSIAASADGKKLAALAYQAPIYTSTNSGVTWEATTSPAAGWYGIASSADGEILVAAAGLNEDFSLGLIYISTDAGVTWSPTSSPSNYWVSVACSADASIITASSGGTNYTSTDLGATWAPTAVALGNWVARSSADGSKLVGGFYGSPGPAYLSTNSEVSWFQAAIPEEDWAGLAFSADGTKIVASVRYPPESLVYISTNSGLTWTSNNAPNSFTGRAVSSADGGRVALISGGYVYVSQSVPTPVLKIAPATNGNAVISWTIPSMPFVLQQNSDLATTNWTEVATTPTVVNLEYQVSIPSSAIQNFYRLKSQ